MLGLLWRFTHQHKLCKVKTEWKFKLRRIKGVWDLYERRVWFLYGWGWIWGLDAERVINCSCSVQTEKQHLLKQVNSVFLHPRPPGWRCSGRETILNPMRGQQDDACTSEKKKKKKSCLPANTGPAWRTGVKACEHVGPFKEMRRAQGSDFLHWRVSEMKSSANPAPCAPGSHGPPACCDSSRSASSSRKLRRILGQFITLLNILVCVFCFGTTQMIATLRNQSTHA